MKKRLLIAIILLSFVLMGPALAVKRVSKSGDQATEQKQGATTDNQAPDKTTPPPERRQEGNKDNQQPSQPQQPPGNGGKDSFIDRDGDGINDNLKKPPETVKRKHESHHEKASAAAARCSRKKIEGRVKARLTGVSASKGPVYHVRGLKLLGNRVDKTASNEDNYINIRYRVVAIFKDI